MISTHELPLADYMGLLKTTMVEVDGKRMPFLFDTAGGFTAITPQLAGALGLSRFGCVTGFNKNGRRHDLPRCGRLELKVADLILRPEAVILDLEALLPPDWPELGGILSLHSFQTQVLTLQLAENRVFVESQEQIADRTEAMVPLAARLARQAGGASLDLFLGVDSPGGQLWLEADTGNTGPVLLAPHALIQLGAADADTASDWKGQLDLTLPSLGSLRVEAEAMELIYDGLLNLATLARLELCLDLPGARAWARSLA